MSLGWATDQENPNLETSPNLDSTDGGDVPIHLDAALSVAKYVDDPTPSVNDTIVYTVTVTNGGPSVATDIETTDLLPTGVTYQSHSTSQGTYNSGSGVWLVGNLVDSGSATLSITALVIGTGEIVNTANITTLNQPDPDLSDNSDSASIYVQMNPPDEADISVFKYVDNHLPYEETNITFTVIVLNSGPATATNIEVTDLLPGTVTYQSHSASPGIYNSGTGIWTIPGLDNGASATLSVTALVNAGTAGSTSFNVASITALGQPDPDSDDNSGTAEFFPLEAPVYPPGPARGVPAFPSIYIAVAVAIGTAILAYLVRRRVLGPDTRG